MQQVTLADDAHHPIVGIDDRNPADPALGQERRERVHGCVRVDGDHLGRHHIRCAHHRSPSLIRATYKPVSQAAESPFWQATSCVWSSVAVGNYLGGGSSDSVPAESIGVGFSYTLMTPAAPRVALGGHEPFRTCRNCYTARESLD